LADNKALSLGRSPPSNRSLRCFVFVTPVDGKRFVALASARDVRWALANRYPWLEQAYATAYAAAVETRSGNVMDSGRIELDWQAAQEVAMNFVWGVQVDKEPTEHSQRWVQLGDVGARGVDLSWFGGGIARRSALSRGGREDACNRRRGASDPGEPGFRALCRAR
jgi:hypothetical protein